MHGCDVLKLFGKLMIKENINTIILTGNIIIREAIHLKVQIDVLGDSTLFTTRK